jgi:deoxyribonuclease V
VVARADFTGPELVAGVDCSEVRGRVRAAVCTFTFPGLEPIEDALAELPLEFPYVPGLLSFRELPAIRAAYGKLARAPDVLLVDGQGIAHPRRLGIASHLGVELDRPTIGCAKSILVGEHRAPAERRGSRARLVHRGEVVGVALRTRAGVKPIYVSIGHRVDLAAAVRIVLACAPRYRVPEPIRRADHLAGIEALT